MAQRVSTSEFQPGKVYCLDLSVDNDTGAAKRILKYRGPDQPWEDICAGTEAQIDVDRINEAIEVPESVVEAIKFAQNKKPLPEFLPENSYEQEEELEPWEGDIYWDD